jgi:hypothetical protein
LTTPPDETNVEGQPGGVAEWLNAPVLKTGRPARVSWVRIPPPPLHSNGNPKIPRQVTHFPAHLRGASRDDGPQFGIQARANELKLRPMSLDHPQPLANIYPIDWEDFLCGELPYVTASSLV